MRHCGNCDFTTRSANEINEHENNFCFKCNKCFSTLEIANHLKEHESMEQEVLQHQCTMCDFSSEFLGNIWIHTTKVHSKELPTPAMRNLSDIEVLMLLLVEQCFSFESNARESSLEMKEMLNKQSRNIINLYKQINSSFSSLENLL